MTAPIPIPDWLPWWVPVALLAPALLYALVFFFMPFSVLGVKGRLDSIEVRLDEIQGEIRSLALRMPELSAKSHFDDLYTTPPLEQARRHHVPLAQPPIPPASRDAEADGSSPGFLGRRVEGTRRAVQTNREEPRLDWPG